MRLAVAAGAIAIGVLTSCSNAGAPQAAPSAAPSPESTASPTKSNRTKPTPKPRSTFDPQRVTAMKKTTFPRFPENSKVPSGDGPLASGEYFGYLKSIDLTTGDVTFDIAQWLSGDAANKAAVEDGVIEEGDGVPNDYYVRNNSKRLRSIVMREDTVITVARCAAECGQFTGSIAGLAASLKDTKPYNLDAPYRGQRAYYWLTVKDNVVQRIDEQFVP